jgi:1-aminocyclopropane-1-carboxylate deaminase/D-cysteine desulfhydrase-like pyridoxal-dependent ACC family enzyme
MNPDAERHGRPAAEPVLFRRFPQLRDSLPWISLGVSPTEVHELKLDGITGLWVKRDDLSAAEYGGNKVRKLEFLLADAQRRGARRLITVGAAGSHHALATALYGKRLGIPVTLVLFPQPLTPHVRDVLQAGLSLGADLRWARRMELIPAAAFLTRVSHRREAPYMIPAGGSSFIGTLGYVNAALELEQQVRDGVLPEPAVIHLAAGTLGTAVGLAVGLALGHLRTRVHAVRIASSLVTNQRTLRSLILGVRQIFVDSGVAVPGLEQIASRIDLSDDSIGKGYGFSTADGIAAKESLAAARLKLDDTYTAKAAAAMLQKVRLCRGEAHLFWHTLSASDPSMPVQERMASQIPAVVRRYLAALESQYPG